MTSSFKEQVHSAESLAEELHGLLAHYGTTLEHAGILDQVEELSRLAECYRYGLQYGLQVADKIYQGRNLWLTGLDNRLKSEARALGRLEGEGGPTGGAANETSGTVETEDFLGAAQKIDSIASHAENLFGIMEGLRRQMSGAGGADTNQKSNPKTKAG